VSGKWVDLRCDTCGMTAQIHDDGAIRCPSCGRTLRSPSQLSLMDLEGIGKDLADLEEMP
jgi:tRNA(Ile2) C34 agmatinyltransferase TiaS